MECRKRKKKKRRRKGENNELRALVVPDAKTTKLKKILNVLQVKSIIKITVRRRSRFN